METKQCKTCNKILPLDSFQKNGNFYRTECKQCRNIKNRDIWNENYQAKKDLINELKTPCIKCGESKHYLIDFHHLNPEDKEIELSSITKKTWSLKRTKEALLKEKEKCICLCANCHREYHYLERENYININDYINGN